MVNDKNDIAHARAILAIHKWVADVAAETLIHDELSDMGLRYRDSITRLAERILDGPR